MPKFICQHCGCENIWADRSQPHHAAFFGFMTYCFEAWPERCEFKPDNPQHLRAWLLVKTNCRAPSMVYQFKNKRELNSVMPFALAKIAHDQRRGIFTWVVEVEGGIALLQPKSLNWGGMGQKEFNQVSAAVFDFVKEYAGIDFEEWKAHA